MNSPAARSPDRPLRRGVIIRDTTEIVGQLVWAPLAGPAPLTGQIATRNDGRPRTALSERMTIPAVLEPRSKDSSIHPGDADAPTRRTHTNTSFFPHADHPDRHGCARPTTKNVHLSVPLPLPDRASLRWRSQPEILGRRLDSVQLFPEDDFVVAGSVELSDSSFFVVSDVGVEGAGAGVLIGR